MTHNYFYQVAKGMQPFETLAEARKAQRMIIKNDLHTCTLLRDNKGYYILKRYTDNRVNNGFIELFQPTRVKILLNQ